MTIPATWDLEAEIVGYVTLVHLDTTEGVLRFLLGEDGTFTDASGNEWLGSKLLSIGAVELSIGDRVPTTEFSFTYTVDTDGEDLVSIARGFGLAAIRDRYATFYLQPLAQYEEFFAPTFSLVQIARRRMMQLRYDISGPKDRRVSVILDGPMNLASKPTNGRYTTPDATRRKGSEDLSHEFMPTNPFDEQSLFGL